jgi:hypothetical protein
VTVSPPSDPELPQGQSVQSNSKVEPFKSNQKCPFPSEIPCHANQSEIPCQTNQSEISCQQTKPTINQKRKKVSTFSTALGRCQGPRGPGACPLLCPSIPAYIPSSSSRNSSRGLSLMSLPAQQILIVRSHSWLPYPLPPPQTRSRAVGPPPRPAPPLSLPSCSRVLVFSCSLVFCRVGGRNIWPDGYATGMTGAIEAKTWRRPDEGKITRSKRDKTGKATA